MFAMNMERKRCIMNALPGVYSNVRAAMNLLSGGAAVPACASAVGLAASAVAHMDLHDHSFHELVGDDYEKAPGSSRPASSAVGEGTTNLV